MKYMIVSVLLLTSSSMLIGAPGRHCGSRPSIGHIHKASPRIQHKAHHYAPPPPRHIHCEWVTIGGVSYLAGSVIRACTDAPNVTYVTYPTQTVVVRESATEIVSADALRADLHANLSSNMNNIPYSIQVNSLEKVGDMYVGNVTAIVAINGNNYNITSGGKGNTYTALKTNLTNEIIHAVESLRNTTTITKIG